MSKKNEVMNNPEVAEVFAFTKEEKSLYKSLCSKISRSVKGLENNYITLAVSLAEVSSGRLFEISGYRNIYDFAKDRYNLSKGTVSKYLGLVQYFGLTADSQPLYTSSQMLEMLPYLRSGGSVDAFTPDMTVREIRERIKEFADMDNNVKRLTGQVEEKRKKLTLFSFHCIEDFLVLPPEELKELLINTFSEGYTVSLVAQ